MNRRGFLGWIGSAFAAAGAGIAAVEKYRGVTMTRATGFPLAGDPGEWGFRIESEHIASDLVEYRSQQIDLATSKNIRGLVPHGDQLYAYTEDEIFRIS